MIRLKFPFLNTGSKRSLRHPLEAEWTHIKCHYLWQHSLVSEERSVPKPEQVIEAIWLRESLARMIHHVEAHLNAIYYII